MLEKRNPQYLRAWLDMYYALQVHNRRKPQDKEAGDNSDTSVDSMGTPASMDLVEYLVDDMDGMDREMDGMDSRLTIGEGEVVLTPPRESLDEDLDATGTVEIVMVDGATRKTAGELRRQ